MSRSRQRANWVNNLRQLLCSCCEDETEAIKYLDLTHSLLGEIPAEVFQCQRTLEALHLDSNHVVELPRQLFNCDELRELSVSDNEISFIPPAISFLQNLQKFDVSKNAVTTLPDTIRQCSSLSYLDLSINPLERLPEGLVNIVSLQELYLTDAYLEFLPANFGKLVNLRILELRENNLSTLPKTMNRLVYLTRLDIGFNEFQELPEVISSLQNLTELWIDGNHIKKLNPSIGQLRKMIHFDASQNNLASLPRDIGYWTKVQDFYISNNELESLPSSIGNLINLVRLKLEENSLRSLPDTIGKLTNLEELMLTHNYLSHLPGSVGLLRKLKVLDIDKNYLTDLPAELGSCVSLSILSIRENRLAEIPAEIGHLYNLKVLNLVDNLINYLPMSILKLDQLSALWLSNNQSQPLMPLQQEKDPETNTNVLTCFMLPQQRSPHPEPGPVPEDDSSSRPRVTPRHIYFAPNISSPYEQSGRLTRAPTPYPKELRALAKHAKQVQKNLTVSQARSGERIPPQAQGSLEIKEATVKIKMSPSSQVVDTVSPQSVEALSEPLVSPLSHSREIEITPTPDSSVSSLPLAYESTPVIREAKNIRTDTQTSTVVHNPTPQFIQVAPAPGKKAIVPPPYHIAAAYSVKAQFFNPETATNQPIAGSSTDQTKITTPSNTISAVSSQHSGQTSTRRLYSGRKSFPYMPQNPSLSESSRAESPTFLFSERSDSQNTNRNLRPNRISPTPMSSDENIASRNISDFSHFMAKNVPDTEYHSRQIAAAGKPILDTSGSSSESKTASDAGGLSEQSHYTLKPSTKESYQDDHDKQVKEKYQDDYDKQDETKSAIQSTSEKSTQFGPDNAASSAIQDPICSGSLSSSEVGIPRSTRSSNVYLTQSAASSLSSGLQHTSINSGTNTQITSSDVSELSTRTNYSIQRPHLNLDEFVSGTETTATSNITSSLATSSYNPSESSSSEPSSRSSFKLLTPPAPHVINPSISMSPIVERDSSRMSSDPFADSVECDLGDSGRNISDTSSKCTSLRYNILPQDRSSTTITGETLTSSETSGSHGISTTNNDSERKTYLGHTSQAQTSTQSTQVIHGHSGRAITLEPANYALQDIRNSTYSGHLAQPQALSLQSSHLDQQSQALPSSQIFSSRPNQSPHVTSTHSGQSSFPDLSVFSGCSFQLTPSSFHQAYLAQGQGIYPHMHLSHSSQSPYQSLSIHSDQTPPANSTPSVYFGLSNRSVHSSYTPRSVHTVQSIHASQSNQNFSPRQSGYCSQSAESDMVDSACGSKASLNETSIRTSNPVVSDNDNASTGDHENNFDNKPRFFVQDKPAPGQNIVAPTPKRPNAADKSSRIPYLTSPTMRRATGYIISEPSSQMSSLQSLTISPRSARRDLSLREVKSDTAIAPGGSGIRKTRIPGPNTNLKPVSPECNRGKKWVFGQHKNATVMNVLIHKNPDLGFSITETADKGIFIDDVKHQECLSVGDKILEVEGIDVTMLRKEEVMEILLAAGRHICMMISHI